MASVPLAADLARRSIARVIPRVEPWAVAMLLVAAITAWSMRGYVGGGSDDWHYLEAARCAAAHGFCLPPTHWWARYPLVVPVGRALALLGETRTVLAVAGACYGAAAAAAFAILLRRAVGQVAALVGTVLLLATPAVASNVARLDIDIPELACALVGLLLLDTGLRRRSTGWVAAGGIAIGLAVATRTTSVALLPPAILLVAWRTGLERRMVIALLLGAALPAIGEAIAYWFAGADPLTSWARASGHVRIASTELSTSVDTSWSPLFNPAYIDGWARASGIRLHWSVDPFLNLVAHPAIGPTMVAAAALAFVHRATVDRRLAIGLALFALYYLVVLAYGLAIDPKPRMFLPAAAAAAAIGGVAVQAGWRTPMRWPGLTLVALLFVTTVADLGRARDLAAAERLATTWIGNDAAATAIDETSRRALPFSDGVRRLPATVDKPAHRLHLAQGRCPATFDALFLARRVPTPALGVGRLLERVGIVAPPLELCWFSRS